MQQVDLTNQTTKANKYKVAYERTKALLVQEKAKTAKL